MGLDEQLADLDQDTMVRIMVHADEVVGKELDYISRLVRKGMTGKWYMLVSHARGEKTAIVTPVDVDLPCPALVEDATSLERWGCCRKCSLIVRDFKTVGEAITHFENCTGNQEI